MKRKSAIIGLILLAAAFLFATSAFSGDAAPDDALSVSNSGAAVDSSRIPPRVRSVLASTGVTGEPRLMGVLGGRAFFRLDGSAGESCYAFGRRGSPPEFGTVACPKGFPTEQVPILDQSAFTYDSTGAVRVLGVEGIAADTVATVGLVDMAEDVHKVMVRNNLYRFSSVPESPVKAIVAFDDSGTELYSVDFTKR